MAQFLSDEWVAKAHEIYDEFRGQTSGVPDDVRINLIVRAAPFGEGTIDAHLDTSGEEVEIDLGHLEGAATTVTTDYDTAKQLLIGQDQSAAMQAFMSGKIQITGDMTKIMLLMQGAPDPAALAIAERLRAVTD